LCGFWALFLLLSISKALADLPVALAIVHRDGTHILSLYNKQANQQCISNKKAEAIANKAQKEALKAERALQAKARRQTCSG